MTEGTRFQQGSLMRAKNKTTPDTWFFRYYESRDGRRVHRNLKIGSVVKFPLRKDAEKAVLSFRATINSEARTPETLHDLVAHYSTHELTPERKPHATLENYRGNLKLYILPKWGPMRLSAVRTVAVEAWLHSLPLAPGRGRRFGIRCPPSSPPASGISSSPSTRLARFGVRRLAFGSRMS